ncbi:MAG: maleylpyruvate isomerase family mycothiol-dependent enzyme [Actinomycetota bacterium]|nr:maleylpyruvate isomerase family mycothiol-dependent enzyme [Actinomycetota bacterium]
MHNHAVAERHELSTTLRSTGPGASTLCGDWTAALLTAHLIQRERSLSEALGRLPVRRFRARAEARLRDLVAGHEYGELVDTFEAGPPRLSPWSVPALREAVNLMEYAIHHEDVRRAAPGFLARDKPVAWQRALWQRLRISAPLTMRAVPVGVELACPAYGAILTRRAKRGAPIVTVTGQSVGIGAGRLRPPAGSSSRVRRLG